MTIYAKTHAIMQLIETIRTPKGLSGVLPNNNNDGKIRLVKATPIFIIKVFNAK